MGPSSRQRRRPLAAGREKDAIGLPHAVANGPFWAPPVIDPYGVADLWICGRKEMTTSTSLAVTRTLQ